MGYLTLTFGNGMGIDPDKPLPKQSKRRSAMRCSKILLTGFVCGAMVLTFGTTSASNYYFFEPETLKVSRGASFEWHMMMENDVELCGYGFTIDAPVGGEGIFTPDTLTFDWTGTGADIGDFGVLIGPEFSSGQDWFGGAAAKSVCPPGLPSGTYISVRICGTISETADHGTYAFWGPHSGNKCDFTDCPGSTFDVPVDTGWIRILPPFIRADADADMDIEMADAVYALRYLYIPGAPDPPCMDAADANDDGNVLMNDVVYTLAYLYVPGAPQPPLPFPDCGPDPTVDELDCNDHPCMTGGKKVGKTTTTVK